MIKYNEDEFIEICNNSKSMQEASIKLKMHFNTFKRIANKLGCYKPNQGLKGIRNNKKLNGKAIPLYEIIEGKHPTYQTFKLKKRLISEGLKKNICENCNISEWMGKKIECELDHIDGDRSNHILLNLKILCPNCHSQTPTFRSKNIK
jgi:hypothetical protein